MRAELEASLPESTFRIWIAPLRPLPSSGAVLRLACPDSKRAWIERRYAPLINGALQRLDTPLHEVALGSPEGGPAGNASRPSGLSAGGTSSKTFERFVIGPGNRMAHAAALAVAEAPGQAYNPLFLYGPPGLGKSHLLTAIANYMRSLFPGLRVHCTSAEAFTNEFLAALASRDVRGFKERHRGVDALLIDDVHFLEDKERTQEEFFHTFNALHEAGGQIVLCADRPPSRLSALTERLRDRFDWGLLVELDRPDHPTRRAVLELLRRESPDSELSDDVAELLVERPFPNLRQLEGAFTQLTARASLSGHPVLPHDLEPELGSARAELDPNAIQMAVAAAFDLPVATLRGRGRRAEVVWARQVAMYLCRQLTGLSLPRIASAFGGRDHTTVLHAIRRVDARISDQPLAAQQVGDLSTKLSRLSPQPSSLDRNPCQNQPSSPGNPTALEPSPDA